MPVHLNRFSSRSAPQNSPVVRFRASSPDLWRTAESTLVNKPGNIAGRWERFIRDRQRCSIIPGPDLALLVQNIPEFEANLGRVLSHQECETLLRLFVDGIPFHAFSCATPKQEHSPALFVSTEGLAPGNLRTDDRTFWVKHSLPTIPGHFKAERNFSDIWNLPFALELPPCVRVKSSSVRGEAHAATDGEGNHNHGVFLVYLDKITCSLSQHFSFPFICQVPHTQEDDDFMMLLRSYWIASQLNIGPRLLGWTWVNDFRGILLSALGGELTLRKLRDLPEILTPLQVRGYRPPLNEPIKCLVGPHGTIPLKFSTQVFEIKE